MTRDSKPRSSYHKLSGRKNFEDIKSDAIRCDGDLFLCNGCGKVFDGGGKTVDIGGSVLRYCRHCYKKRFAPDAPTS